MLNGEAISRKLAAMLAADVAGCSRSLKWPKKDACASQTPVIRCDGFEDRPHKGRNVKNTGDGALVEFASAVEAGAAAAG